MAYYITKLKFYTSSLVKLKFGILWDYRSYDLVLFFPRPWENQLCKELGEENPFFSIHANCCESHNLFIIRKDLHLTPGKLGAMIAHCAEGYWIRLIERSIKIEDNKLMVRLKLKRKSMTTIFAAGLQKQSVKQKI